MEIKNTSNQEASNITSTAGENNTKGKLEGISFLILMLTFLLSPLLFISSSYFPMESIKSEIIIFGVLISFVLYLFSSLKKRTVYFPKNPVMIVSIFIIISTIISALLSTNVPKSLIGQGFEIGSASFLILMFISMCFISNIVSRNSGRFSIAYRYLTISFLILGILHILRMIFSISFLSFGVLNSITATFIGKWSDLGVFAGAIFLIAFFTMKLVSRKKKVNIFNIILLVISAIIVFVVNSSIIWLILALVLLAYGIYEYTKKVVDGAGLKAVFSKIPKITAVFFIVAAILAFTGTSLQKSVLKSFSQDSAEISLPWQLTLDVTADTIKEKPLFGAGPNRFGTEFLLHKPLVLNPSVFWNVEFGTGFGFLPTIVATQGVVGTLLWIIFLVLFFTLGVRGLKKARGTQFEFAIISSFFSAAFLWVMSLLFSPSHVVLFLTFAMTGLFFSALYSAKILSVNEIKSSDGTKYAKLITPVLVVVIILALIWGLIYIKKFIALSFFQSGLSTLNVSASKDIEGAESSFKKALAWDKADIYYQVLSSIDLMKVSPILQTLQEQSQKDPKSVDQELIKKLTSIITEAASSSIMAVNIDPTNYYNYLSNAKVFELAASLKFDKAYENAKAAYGSALNYNPYSPSIYLSLAQLSVSNDKADEAQQFIGNALQLKQNYTEAIFLLSQIQVSQNRIKDAIISAQVLTQINPQNPFLFFQLGLLQYNDKNYQAAADALTKAVEFNTQYANARYFLGLSLSRLDKNLEAIAQFEEIAKTNPDNQEVASIIANLKSGKSAFADVKNPADTKPEKRSTLPVKEKAVNNTNNTTKGKTTN